MFTLTRTPFLLVAFASSVCSLVRAVETAAVARALPIATDAFAGSSINVVANIRSSLVTHSGVQYAAYYDAEGYVVLAKRPLGSDRWETRRTHYRGDVADAHRSISIEVDGSGFLHVWRPGGKAELKRSRAMARGRGSGGDGGRGQAGGGDVLCVRTVGRRDPKRVKCGAFKRLRPKEGPRRW